MKDVTQQLADALRDLLALDPAFRHMLSPGGMWTEQPEPGSTAAEAVSAAHRALTAFEASRAAPDDVVERVDEYIRSLVTCAQTLSQAEWRWGQFTRPDGSPIETVDHVCEAQEKSARMSDKAELWGVDLGVDAPVVCYTGNGPRSKDHAQYIAAVRPEVILWILNELGERIERLKKERDVARSALPARDEGLAAQLSQPI